MHTGTRAVTWSAAAERKQERNHPAHIDRHVYRNARGVWMIVRECEVCGSICTREMEQFEPISWDQRGVVSGLCPKHREV